MIRQPIILLTTHAPGTSRMGPRSAAASFPHARDSRRFRFYDESGGATERSFANIEPEPRGLEEDSPDVRKKSPMPIFAGTSSDQELESPVVFLLTLQYMPRFTVQRPGTDAPEGRDGDGCDALVGLSLAGRYLITWRTLWALGSSHHGTGEKSLTKRTHMSVLLRVDKEEGRRPRPAAVRRIGKLAAGSRRKPSSRKSALQIRHDGILRTQHRPGGESLHGPDSPRRTR